MPEFQVGDTIYEFPEGMSDADVTAALQETGVLQGAEFQDVQSGTSAAPPPRYAKPDEMAIFPEMAPGAERHPMAEFGRDVVGGIESGITNVLNFAEKGTLRPSALIPQSMLPEGSSVPPDHFEPSQIGKEADGLGGFLGRSLPALAVPQSAGVMAAGAVGGIANSGDVKGAVEGAVAGKIGQKVLGAGLTAGSAIRQYLTSKAAREVGGEVLSRLPILGKLKTAVEDAATLLHPERVVADKAAVAVDENMGRMSKLATKLNKGEDAARKGAEKAAQDFDLDLDLAKTEARVKAARVEGGVEGPKKPSFDERLQQKGLATKGEPQPTRLGGPATKKFEAKRAVEATEKPKGGKTPKKNVDPENPSEAYRNRRNPNWKPRSEWMANQEQKAALMEIERELGLGNHAKARIVAKERLGLSSTEIKNLFKDFK